jgi:hypothetical protein
MARGRTISAAERARIARLLARAQQASERDAVRIIRRLYESIKDLPPEQAIALLREAMGPAAEAVAASIATGYAGAAEAGGRLVGRRVMGGGDRAASRALRARYAAQGGIRLSAAIHGTQREILRKVEDAVARAVYSGRGAIATAYEIRDKYKHTPRVDLTRKLDELSAKARAAIAASGDPRALRAFQRTAASLDSYAAKLLRADVGMQAATQHTLDQIVRAVKRSNDEAVDRALHWWVYDKQAYHARMIARTETARGLSEGIKESARDTPWVVGWKWNVETGGGRKRDICDVLANQNLYNLGPGVYPFDRVPECPAHPNCACFITEWIDESVGVDDQRPAAPPQRQGATAAWLRSQPASVQREILGSGGFEAFRRSDFRQVPASLRV